jgi:hypothetical protein
MFWPAISQFSWGADRTTTTFLVLRGVGRFTTGQLYDQVQDHCCTGAVHQHGTMSWAETEPQVRVRRHGWRRQKPQRYILVFGH